MLLCLSDIHVRVWFIGSEFSLVRSLSIVLTTSYWSSIVENLRWSRSDTWFPCFLVYLSSYWCIYVKKIFILFLIRDFEKLCCWYSKCQWILCEWWIKYCGIFGKFVEININIYLNFGFDGSENVRSCGSNIIDRNWKVLYGWWSEILCFGKK